MTASSRTGFPSSETAAAPADFWAARSTTSLPASPRVAAVTTCSATGDPEAAADRSIAAVIPGRSFTGSVLAMAKTAR